MRIIGGSLKGRKFYPPADKWPTRPTTDFSKEGLFNILQNRLEFDKTRFLDLFGGTGSHSFEMISRGCTDVTYVDRFRPCVMFVRALAAELGVSDRIRIVRRDVFRFIKKQQESYDYIFAGPPYNLTTIRDIPNLIFSSGLLNPAGLFVLEHNRHISFDNHPHCSEVRTYGQCHFSFFENTSELP